MNVNLENFEQALAIIRSMLPSATFVSVDLEFTGLGDSRPSQLDTPAIRYENARKDAEQFLPLQFGLTIFRPTQPESVDINEEPANTADMNAPDESVDDSGQIQKPLEQEPPRIQLSPLWEAIPFNFYLLPRALYYPRNERYPLFDRIFSMQASSVEFLLKNYFDFRQSFEAGVSWLRKDKEAFVRQKVESVLLARDQRREVVKPDAASIEFKPVRRFRNKIQNWVNEISKQNHFDREGKYVAPSTTVPLPKIAMHRKLSYDAVRDICPRLVYTSLRTDGFAMLQIKRMETEQEATELMDKLNIEQRDYEVESVVAEAIGFRFVIDALKESKVPLIIHNGFLDLSKIIANFIDPLPEDLCTFKSMLKEAFPTIVDTRLLQSQLLDKRPDIKSMMYKARAREMSEVINVFSQNEAEGKLPPARVGIWVPKGRLVGAAGQLGSSTWVDAHLGGFYDERNYENNDVFGFGRYARAGTVHHEAGYDAYDTGRLLISILSADKGRSWTADGGRAIFDECDVLKSVKNKVFLGACGAYQYIDIDRKEEDEEEVMFKKERAVVCSGLWEGESGSTTARNNYERHRRTLEKITEGSRFDGKLSDVISVAERVFIAVLVGEQTSSDEANGNEANADVAQSADGGGNAIEATATDGNRCVQGSKVGLKRQRFEEIVSAEEFGNQVDSVIAKATTLGISVERYGSSVRSENREVKRQRRCI